MKLQMGQEQNNFLVVLRSTVLRAADPKGWQGRRQLAVQLVACVYMRMPLQEHLLLMSAHVWEIPKEVERSGT